MQFILQTIQCNLSHSFYDCLSNIWPHTILIIENVLEIILSHTKFLWTLHIFFFNINLGCRINETDFHVLTNTLHHGLSLTFRNELTFELFHGVSHLVVSWGTKYTFDHRCRDSRMVQLVCLFKHLFYSIL